jgi:hypothetical protein
LKWLKPQKFQEKGLVGWSLPAGWNIVLDEFSGLAGAIVVVRLLSAQTIYGAVILVRAAACMSK